MKKILFVLIAIAMVGCKKDPVDAVFELQNPELRRSEIWKLNDAVYERAYSALTFYDFNGSGMRDVSAVDDYKYTYTDDDGDQRTYETDVAPGRNRYDIKGDTAIVFGAPYEPESIFSYWLIKGNILREAWLKENGDTVYFEYIRK